MTAKHTPTPWTARASYTRGPDDKYTGRYEIRTGKSDSYGYAPLAYVWGDRRETGRDGGPNAAFIIRAVNSHEALIALLKEIYEEADASYTLGSGNHRRVTLGEISKKVGAALAALGEPM